MTEPPIILIYCDGPEECLHDREPVAPHQRAHSTPTSTPGLWIPVLEWNGKRLSKFEQYRYDTRLGAPRNLWLGYRFRCKRCKLDERRTEHPGNFGGRMYAVFDAMWIRGDDPLEISVRDLLAEIDALDAS